MRGTCSVNVTAKLTDWPEQESGDQLLLSVEKIKLPDIGVNCTMFRLDIVDHDENNTVLTRRSFKKKLQN